MISIPWWQLVLLLYLIFNVGFHVRELHDRMWGDPVFPHWHRYTRWQIVGGCIVWMIAVVMPVSILWLGDVFWKRPLVELRIRGMLHHAR